MKFILFFLLLFSFPIFSQEIPERLGPITDDSGIISEDFIKKMDNKLIDFSKKFGPQVGVLVVYSIGETPIAEYSIKVAEKWKLGRKDINDGVLVVLVIENNKVRIEVGYGLEHVLTDLESNKIIKKDIIPHLKKKKYEEAIESGVNSIFKKLEKGELGDAPPKKDKNSFVDKKTISQFSFFLLFITIISILTSGLKLDKLFLLGVTGVFYLVGMYVSVNLAFLILFIAIIIYIILKYLQYAEERKKNNYWRDDDDDNYPGFWTTFGGNWGIGGGSSEGGFFGGGSDSGGDFGSGGGDFGGGGSDGGD